MRACSFYNGLILCGRHCFTIVAHNWKFWQMYFAWNIVPKLYMCICIVLWMYFLTLTPECKFFCLLVCYTVSLKTFPGTWPPYLYCTVSCMSYSLCVHFKRTALWLKQAWILSGEMHFYLFKSPRWLSNWKDCFPPFPWLTLTRFIYQADGIVMIFVLLNSKMFSAWLLWWFSCI